MRLIKTVYYCDFCGKELKEKSHICIEIGHYAGIVKPPEWKHIRKLESRPYQFCDIDHCLTGFLLYNSTKKEIKKSHNHEKSKK